MKFASGLVAKDTYSVCVPVGAGESVAGVLVAQSCQPPVPLTSIVANAVAAASSTSP